MKHDVKRRSILSRRLPAIVAVSCVLVAVAAAVISCTRGDKEAPADNQGISKSFERGPVKVTVSTDKKEMNIAQKLDFTITVEHSEDCRVELPGVGEKLESFGIVDYSTSDPVLMDDNKVRVERKYILEPFLSGKYTIPAMAVNFYTAENPDKQYSVETEPLTVTVNSLLPEEMEELKIRDIVSPVELPASKVWMGVALGSLFVVVIIAVVLLLVLRRKRRISEEETRLSAHELAYLELKRLIDEDLLGRGETKQFYYRVSGILRRYIENRFGLKAPEQTTQEFLDVLAYSDLLEREHKKLLRDFLGHCDMVKFAEYQPGSEEIQNTFDSCRSFIEATEPSSEQEAASSNMRMPETIEQEKENAF